MPLTAVKLEDRGVLAVSGPEARDFLQTILTNDIRRATPDRAIYAALLTPQGKYLFDFFIVEEDGVLLIDCERARKDELLRKLMLYRLRAKAEIVDRSDDLAVWALVGEADEDRPSLESAKPGTLFADPRLAEMGWRASLPADAGSPAKPAEREAYETRRLALGLPDGSRDFEVDRTLALEGNLDLLGAVDFEKGCYVGQEITARMKHRGKVRKRLLPVHGNSGDLSGGAEIRAGGKPVGDLRSVLGDRGIALLRLDALEAGGLEAGGVSVSVIRPSWLEAPASPA